MIDTYTRTLFAVSETGDTKAADAAVRSLIAHLKSTGRLKSLPAIVRALKKLLARRAALAPVVEVAHEKDTKRALSEAVKAGISAEIARVNPLLVSGWRARSAGTLVDRSAKAALITIYKKVTV